MKSVSGEPSELEMVTLSRAEYEDLMQTVRAYEQVRAVLGHLWNELIDFPSSMPKGPERAAYTRALMGKYRDVLSSSEEFAQRKQEEIRLESRFS